MVDIHLEVGASVAIPKIELGNMLDCLRQMGYQTIGPRIKDEAITYDQIHSLEDLPRGYTSEQKNGHYRLVSTDHSNYFDVTPGQKSWKSTFFPSITEIFNLRKDGKHWQANSTKEEPPSNALIGVRPCELSAILNQDQIFMRDDWQDSVYRSRREWAFLVAVNCLHPCGTCFCASMGTGPEATQGFDLCLTELDDVFLVKIGSATGQMVMTKIECKPASAFWLQAANNGLEKARENMGRKVTNLETLPELLLSHLETERWDLVAKRCLSCANCTQVCPTCFCWDTRDSSSLDGQTVVRERVWDSCFNPDYSYVVNGNTRPTTRSRYRQWLTHKFASWKHQFGQLGCVGCGRCITWCPAGIDITEEIAAIQQESAQ